MKKRYNPFKMWGSYVGALIFFVAIYVFIYYLNKSMTPWYETFFGFQYTSLNIFILIFSTIVGFISGWSIHSLARALK